MVAVSDLSSGDVRIGIVGFTTEDTPELIFPGNLGPFHLVDDITTVNAEAARINGRVDAIVALGHEGVNGGTLTDPAGPIVDLADAALNIDSVIGDHNDFQVLTNRPNGVLLTQNRGRGARFTRIRLVIDEDRERVVYKTADFHKPWNIGVTPDPTIQAEINRLNDLLRPIFGTVIGTSTTSVPRSDECGRADGRLCESKIGNFVTDAMRNTYATTPGADFAITNSGGLRADLTCPATDNPDDFCPAYATMPPPFNVTRGSVNGVLPFGNIVVTLPNGTGADLKAMLENGVSQSVQPSAGPTPPAGTPVFSPQGRFPQVSGLCFTWDIQAASGNRITGARRQATDGTCTGAMIDLTASGGPYRVLLNDFIASGGDGYPNVLPRVTTLDIMDQVVADYTAANSPIGPSIQGRIQCVDSNTTAPPSCPTPVPVP